MENTGVTIATDLKERGGRKGGMEERKGGKGREGKAEGEHRGRGNSRRPHYHGYAILCKAVSHYKSS